MDSFQSRISNLESRVWLRSTAVFIVLMGMITLALAADVDKTAQKPDSAAGSGSSITSPAAIGASISAIVELGDMYRTTETYDVRITVLEILRGKPATDLLTKAGAFNAPVQKGFECVLARIRFEYAARGAPGDKPWELTGGQFSAFSGDGKPYEMPTILPPVPRLSGTLRSGDSMQGWVAFVAALEDKKPVMTFGPGSIWFRLY